MALTKRILKSSAFQGFVIWCLAQYIRLCWATTRWEFEGLDALKEQLRQNGPVIVVLWHEHLIYAPKAWPLDVAPVCSLTQDAHAGRFAGLILEWFGFENRSLSAGASELKILREVMALAKGGVSVGIAADGPEGPARHAKMVPVVWSRSTGLPLWTFGYRTTRYRRMNTWDRMILPLPFSKGHLRFAKFSDPVPRKAGPVVLEETRRRLEEALGAKNDDTG